MRVFVSCKLGANYLEMLNFVYLKPKFMGELLYNWMIYLSEKYDMCGVLKDNISLN
jgi:hypothetical protein